MANHSRDEETGPESTQDSQAAWQGWAKAHDFSSFPLLFLNLLILEKEEGKGERQRETSICCSTYAFIGCFLYVP